MNHSVADFNLSCTTWKKYLYSVIDVINISIAQISYGGRKLFSTLYSLPLPLSRYATPDAFNIAILSLGERN